MILKGRKPTKLDSKKVLYIRKSLALKTETVMSLAKKYKTSFQAIYQIARGNVWKYVGGDRLKKKSRVFTREEILEIKRTPWYHGVTMRLGEKFGVHHAVIGNIMNGHRWKNITP